MIGIALGVMVLITVLSVMNGFSKEVRERILSVTPHLTITNHIHPIYNWSQLAQNLKNNEIIATGPFIDGQGMLIEANEVKGVMVKGVLPEEVEAVFPLENALVEGQLSDLKAGQFGVILGLQLARSLGVSVGDKVTLIVPEMTVSMAGAMPRLKRLKVVGIFEVGYLYDHGYAFMHINDAGKLFKLNEGVSGIHARLKDPFSSPRLMYDIAKNLTPEFSVIDWTTQNSTYFSAVKMEKTMMFFTLMMILAIAVFNLVSTMIMVVTDKRADIAILRTLGASTTKITTIFICQGALIGCTGTLLGVVLGITLALNVTDIVSFIEHLFSVQFISADVYFISFLPSQLLWRDVAIIGLSALTLSLIATIWPALRAAKTTPAEALRHEN